MQQNAGRTLDTTGGPEQGVSREGHVGTTKAGNRQIDISNRKEQR